MPEKITAYRCKFRCGHRVNTKKESILEHEKICFSNPKRRACKTCLYWDFDEDGRFCEKEKIPGNEYAVYRCEYWKLGS